MNRKLISNGGKMISLTKLYINHLSKSTFTKLKHYHTEPYKWGLEVGLFYVKISLTIVVFNHFKQVND